jgi:hypothetical protein
MALIKNMVGLFQGTRSGRCKWIIVCLLVLNVLVVNNMHGHMSSIELGNKDFPDELSMTNQTCTIIGADALSSFQPKIMMGEEEHGVDQEPTVPPPSNPLDRNQSQADPYKMREDIGVSSFVDVCAELFRRANGTLEGDEPWRASGGLLWIRSPCGHQGLHMLGNHLSQWYIARAIASDAGISIQSQCQSPVTDLIPQFWEPNDTILDDRASFSWKVACQNDHVSYPHGTFERGNGLNHLVTAIRLDLRGMTQNILKATPWLANDLDHATIHIRTGDVGRKQGSNGKRYGMVPFHVYKKLLPNTAKTIGIVTAPFRQDRGSVGFGDAELNEAVVTAARDYIQREFPEAKVSIRNDDVNETMAMTYARLVASKWSFCGSSTFCLFPALATTGESYILQSQLYGGRRGRRSWINKVVESFPNVHYVNEPFVRSIDFWKWNVSEIVKRLERNEDQ